MGLGVRDRRGHGREGDQRKTRTVQIVNIPHISRLIQDPQTPVICLLEFQCQTGTEGSKRDPTRDHSHPRPIYKQLKPRLAPSSTEISTGKRQRVEGSVKNKSGKEPAGGEWGSGVEVIPYCPIVIFVGDGSCLSHCWREVERKSKE